MKNELQGNFMQSMIITQIMDCAICLCRFSDSDEVTVLACSDKHYFHSDCAKGWVDSEKAKNKSPECPLCRNKIDEALLKKRKIRENDQIKVDLADDLQVFEPESEMKFRPDIDGAAMEMAIINEANAAA